MTSPGPPPSDSGVPPHDPYAQPSYGQSPYGNDPYQSQHAAPHSPYTQPYGHTLQPGQPGAYGYAPPRRGMSSGAIVLIVVGIVLVLFGLPVIIAVIAFFIALRGATDFHGAAIDLHALAALPVS